MLSDSDDNTKVVEWYSYQYGRLIDEKYSVYDTLVDAGRSLDGKANSLMQSGGFILALSAAAGIANWTQANMTDWALTAALVSAVAFIAMIVISLVAWSPSDYEVPGTTKSWDSLYDDYIELSPDACDAQVLRDLFNAINSLKKRNGIKVKLVRISSWLLVVQVVGIALAAFLA